MITTIKEYKKVFEKFDSLEYDLKEWFDKINKECFSGSVQYPTEFKYKPMKNALGKCHVKYSRPFNEKNVAWSAIYITNMFKLSEKTFKDIMCHEMIHLYHFQQHIADGHGFNFKRAAQRINNLNLGYNITRTNDDAGGLNMNQEDYNKEYLFVIMKSFYGERFTKLKWDQRTLNYILYDLDNKKGSKLVDSYEFYKVNDPEFETLPTNRYKNDGNLKLISLRDTVKHNALLSKVRTTGELLDKRPK